MKKLLVLVMSVVCLGMGVAMAGDDDAEAKSQAVKSSSYDAATKVLTIEFERGTYKYTDVSAEVYEAFKNSESQGTYYRNEIKGKYASSKVETAEDAKNE